MHRHHTRQVDIMEIHNSGGSNRRLLNKNNSPLDIVIQFPIKKGHAPLGHPVLSLRTGLCARRAPSGHPVLSLRMGLCAHTLLAALSQESLVEQTLIELQSTKCSLSNRAQKRRTSVSLDKSFIQNSRKRKELHSPLLPHPPEVSVAI